MVLEISRPTDQGAQHGGHGSGSNDAEYDLTANFHTQQRDRHVGGTTVLARLQHFDQHQIPDQDVRQKNPARWSGQTRNWTPVDAVTLNPERDSVVKAAVAGAHIHAAA